MLAGKIFATAHIVHGYMDCTFTFDETNYLRHCILRWYGRDQIEGDLPIFDILSDSQGLWTLITNTFAIPHISTSSYISVSIRHDTCVPMTHGLNSGCPSTETSFPVNFERFTDRRFSLYSRNCQTPDELSTVRTELKEDIAGIREDMLNMEGSMIKWFIGTSLAMTGMLSGIVFALLKFVQ